MDRIEKIMNLVKEEAKHRTCLKDYQGRIYDVLLDVHLEGAQLLKSIRDQERPTARTEGD